MLSSLFGGCGPSLEEPVEGEVVQSPPPSELATPSVYGIWVYGPGEWIDDKTRVDAFISLLLRNGINEVYLSTNFALLENPALPAFLLRMSNNGFSTEALIGKTIWAQAAGRPDMLSQIDRIKSYNASRPYVERFKAIHLDVEPWIGTGTNTSWVTPLTNSYIIARERLAGSGMRLSVDFSGSKGANLGLSQRQAIAGAADQVVLMLYEATQLEVLSRATRFMSGLHSPSKVVMAVRSEDFAEPFAIIETMHGSMIAANCYQGRAIYHYDTVRAP